MTTFENYQPDINNPANALIKRITRWLDQLKRDHEMLIDYSQQIRLHTKLVNIRVPTEIKRYVKVAPTIAQARADHLLLDFNTKMRQIVLNLTDEIKYVRTQGQSLENMVTAFETTRDKTGWYHSYKHIESPHRIYIPPYYDIFFYWEFQPKTNIDQVGFVDIMISNQEAIYPDDVETGTQRTEYSLMRLRNKQLHGRCQIQETVGHKRFHDGHYYEGSLVMCKTLNRVSFDQKSYVILTSCQYDIEQQLDGICRLDFYDVATKKITDWLKIMTFKQGVAIDVKTNPAFEHLAGIEVMD